MPLQSNNFMPILLLQLHIDQQKFQQLLPIQDFCYLKIFQFNAFREFHKSEEWILIFHRIINKKCLKFSFHEIH